MYHITKKEIDEQSERGLHRLKFSEKRMRKDIEHVNEELKELELKKHALIKELTINVIAQDHLTEPIN